MIRGRYSNTNPKLTDGHDERICVAEVGSIGKSNGHNFAFTWNVGDAFEHVLACAL
jgi:hypothetical protein